MSTIFKLTGREFEPITDELEVARLAMVADTDADPEKRTAAIARLGRAGRFADPTWRPSALAKNTAAHVAPSNTETEKNDAPRGLREDGGLHRDGQPVEGADAAERAPGARTDAAGSQAADGRGDVLPEARGLTLPCGGQFARHRFLGQVHCVRCGAVQPRPDRVEKAPPPPMRDDGIRTGGFIPDCPDRVEKSTEITPARSETGVCESSAGTRESADRQQEPKAGASLSSPAPAPTTGAAVAPTGPAPSPEVATGGAGSDVPTLKLVTFPSDRPIEIEFANGSTLVVGKRGMESLRGGSLDNLVMDADEPDWTDRRNYLGSGDIAAVVGASARSGPMDVYLAKVLPAEEEEGEEAEWLRMGTRLQPVIAAEVCERLGLVRSCLSEYEVHDPSRPHLRAHIDDSGFVSGEVGTRIVIESKATMPWAVEWRDLDEDECSQAALVQVTYQRALAEKCEPGEWSKRMVVARFLNLGVRVYELEYDAELGALLLDAADRFWREHVVAKVPPPLTDDLEAGRTYLRRRFSKSNGHTRPPTDEERALFADLRAAKDEARAAKAKADALALRLHERIGDFDGLDGLATLRDGGAAVSWKAVAEDLADILDRELGAEDRITPLVKARSKAKGRSLRLLGEKDSG